MATEHVTDALAHAARSLNDLRSLDETLDAILRTARMSIPGADHVGVCVAYADGRLETLAATDDKVREYDALQSRLGEGPCVYADEADTLVHVPDATTETRWPAYMAEAADLGLGSQIGVQLHSDKISLGALNIYSETIGALDDASAQAADLFAAHASLAMGKARTISQLQEGMHSRQRIGIAIGILMHQYELTEERAFSFLVRASSHGNVKLREVAAEIVDTFEARLAEVVEADDTEPVG